MVFRLKSQLSKRFEEEVQFLKGWQRDKKGVGAVIPTSVRKRAAWQALSI